MTVRAQLEVEGIVQGVGFRPFVYRSAKEACLGGFVRNTPGGVELEIEGDADCVREFISRVRDRPPPLARVDRIDVHYLAPRGDSRFQIVESARTGRHDAMAAPDAATCQDCLDELFDPDDRRYRYPFTNCTACGPRLSIILDIPYDRPNTTMRNFQMCEACEREYHDPESRRFHAQPNACPQCGPQLSLLDRAGRVLSVGGKSLHLAEHALTQGRIVALKGLGGFQLLCDARCESVVARLRARKCREEKPLAIMVDSVAAAREVCELSHLEEAALQGPRAPILLVRSRARTPIARAIAPRNHDLGVLLPVTPLHHLLTRDLGFPLVATSGNRTDEPIARDNDEAIERLGDVADVFLVHDRPIARRVDDSVARVTAGSMQVLRRARGFSPEPIKLRASLPRILAVGAHLKTAVAVAAQGNVIVSQHLGDLDSALARQGFEQAISDLLHLYRFEPEMVACDLHPDYTSTRFAERLGLPLVRVQHHHAHAASCLADAGLWQQGEALAVTWDGTGYGTDGTVWGGEFLVVNEAAAMRVAHLRPFRLPGGEAAVREPRRVALAVLWEHLGDDVLRMLPTTPLASAFRRHEAENLIAMLGRGTNSPKTSSMGRLFDVVASLTGLRQRNSFEGQAAMELEHVLDPHEAGAYPFPVSVDDPMVLDWGPLVDAILADLRSGAAAGTVSARFHNALARTVQKVVRHIGSATVALSGGCFQNVALTERVSQALSFEDVRLALHRQVPPNDGGIALGQVVIAASQARR